MSKEPTAFDVITDGLDRLLIQYKGLPKIEALITSYLTTVQQLEDATLSVYSEVLNLDEAEGVNLDVVGSILVEPRGLKPDIVYRRVLKTKIASIKSSGTINDIINIVALFQDILNEINSRSNNIVYVTTNTFEYNAKEIEVNFIDNEDHQYEDQHPFFPQINHELLEIARGAGERLQTIWAIARLGETPTTSSLRFTYEDDLETQWGASYLNDTSGTLGGTFAHVQQGASNIIPDFSFVNVQPPQITYATFDETTGAPAVGTKLLFAPGVWLGNPDFKKYLLARNDGPDTLPVPVDGTGSILSNQSILKDLSFIQDYELTAEDIVQGVAVLEFPFSPKYPFEANEALLDILTSERNQASNTIMGPGHAYGTLFGDNTVKAHWTFDYITDVAGAVDLVHDQIGTADLSDLSSTNRPTAIKSNVIAYSAPNLTPIGSFNPNIATFDGIVQKLFLLSDDGLGVGQTLSQPTNGVILFKANEHTVVSGGYILGNTDISDDGLLITSGSKFQLNMGSSIETTSVDAEADLLTAVYFRISGSDSRIWVNNFQSDNYSVLGNVGLNNWEAFTLGASNLLGGHMTGSVYELAIMTGSTDLQTSASLQRWANYLNAKWGTAINNDGDWNFRPET